MVATCGALVDQVVSIDELLPLSGLYLQLELLVAKDQTHLQTSSRPWSARQQ